MPVKKKSKSKHAPKARKNFMLTEDCLEYLEILKTDIFPELSYSQIVDRAISEYAMAYTEPEEPRKK